MSLRRSALQSVADALANSVQLPAPPTIVDASPSEPAVFPAMALLMDKFMVNWSNSWDIEVDDSGQPLIGTNASLSPGVGVAKLPNGRYLSRFGTLRGEGRIWVAARHPAKREELEEQVLFAFCQDGFAPGRMLATLRNCNVGDFVIPWPWTVAATIDEDVTWQDEFVFVERVWSFIKFRLDVDMLVPRNEPLVKEFILQFNNEFYFTPPTGDDMPIMSYNQGFSGGFGG